MRKITSILIAAAFLLTAVIAVVPSAEAQSQGNLVITLTPPSGAVKPLQAPQIVRGTADLTVDGSGFTGVTGIPVTFTARAPAWASAVISPASAVFVLPQNSPGASVTSTLNFQVSVTATDSAPAFQAETLEITGVTQAGSQSGSSFTGKGQTVITADYFSIIDVQLAESIKVERPQTPVVFPLKITNFGNANTKVSFEILEKSANLQVPVPNPVTLQSKQAGGNQITAEVPLTIQTPYRNGYLNEVGIVNYKITSAYALDPKLTGDESTVSVLVTTKGFYVPGPGPLAFLAVIGIAALAARRRFA